MGRERGQEREEREDRRGQDTRGREKREERKEGRPASKMEDKLRDWWLKLGPPRHMMPGFTSTSME
jgi:hypothetical protein